MKWRLQKTEGFSPLSWRQPSSGYGALNRYALQALPSIRIIVKNGNVTLEGVVDSQNDKNIAGPQANSVSGVFSVTNNLRLENQS